MMDFRAADIISQLVNASILRESQNATKQGKDIGLLTNMTVVRDNQIFLNTRLLTEIGIFTVHFRLGKPS
jgi:hypothetical protein